MHDFQFYDREALEALQAREHDFADRKNAIIMEIKVCVQPCNRGEEIEGTHLRWLKRTAKNLRHVSLLLLLLLLLLLSSNFAFDTVLSPPSTSCGQYLLAGPESKDTMDAAPLSTVDPVDACGFCLS